MSCKRKLYLACVTGQKSGARIIRAAGKILAEGEADASVLSILPKPPSASELEAINYLYSVSSEAGLDMTVLTGEHPVFATVEYIKKHHVTHVLTGIPDSGKGGFIDLLSAVLPKVKIITVPQESPMHRNDEDRRGAYLNETSSAMYELLMAY